MSKENASTDLVLSAASRQPASSLSLSIDLIKSRDFADTQRRLQKAGAMIVKPIFSFPGGRRLHFTDPDGFLWTLST